MIQIDKTFNKEEKTLLAKLKDQKINNIQGAFRFDDKDVWNTLRINADNMSLDVNLFQEALPVCEEDNEFIDETGVFSIKEATAGKLVIDAVPLEIKTKQIEEKVERVKIFESEIMYFENGKQYYQNNIVKAVAFKLMNKWLVLDRKVWFDEAITIAFCEDVRDGIRDDSQDWKNEEDENSNNTLAMKYELKSYEL